MGRLTLDDYRDIVGDTVLSDIYRKAVALSDKHVLHMSSTYMGGGVAEILRSLVLLMNDIGIDTGWRVLPGSPDFFGITKKFHNGLQGETINLTKTKKHIYVDNNESFSIFTHINHDCVVVHDPQPLPLIKFYKKRQPWVWRAHIDMSAPNGKVWEYLKTFVLRYDRVIFSQERYSREDLPIPQVVIPPSIDPLSPKNMELPERTIRELLDEYGVPTDKPLVTQVARFDKWKGSEDVADVFGLVKEKVDCRLVLCGDIAPDDPEGREIYERLTQKVRTNKDITLVIGDNRVFVNSLQRASSVIVQKSLREGFGLTVAEAMWKGKPVIASNVGGLPFQVVDGETGFLVDPHDLKDCADKTVMLLKDPELAREMGRKGKERVKENFLITRHLADYIDLYNDLMGS